MPVSEQNCHPFQWGRYLWMHNGVVGGFNAVRRALLATLSDAAYNTVQSFHSDSAVCFALFLNNLPSLTAPQPPDALLRAMQAAVATVVAVQAAAGVAATSLLNFVVSDGATMIATRFVYPEADTAASLYYAEGVRFFVCRG
jgi:predicted glutamine amidotransferase